MRILIVDDETLVREELRDALERVSPGNEIHETYDYDSAVTMLGKLLYDIVFLDIRLNGKSGLAIAELIKKQYPDTNIIIVTAYSEYALDAMRLFVSGYLLKPFGDSELIEVLDNLRYPVRKKTKMPLEVRCFGNFDVFIQGVPMSFKRKKEKELLAYLVCLKGASASKNEICANIYEESIPRERINTNFRQVISSLKKDLKQQGFEQVLLHQNNNAYAIDTTSIHCDYYDWLTGEASEKNRYRGEFMKQYSWAEQYVYILENY